MGDGTLVTFPLLKKTKNPIGNEGYIKGLKV